MSEEGKNFTSRKLFERCEDWNKVWRELNRNDLCSIITINKNLYEVRDSSNSLTIADGVNPGLVRDCLDAYNAGLLVAVFGNFGKLNEALKYPDPMPKSSKLLAYMLNYIKKGRGKDNYQDQITDEQFQEIWKDMEEDE